MTIIRADAWAIRAGRMNEVHEFARKMKPMIRRHGGASPRLMRTAIGGPGSGIAYGEIEFADLESHGRVIGNMQADEEVWRVIEQFYSSDGPVNRYEMALIEVLADLCKRTESTPGCVEIIRTFRIAPEHLEKYVALASELAGYADQHNARLRILQGLSGRFTGQTSQVVELPDMPAFGRYIDDLSSKPAISDLTSQLGEIAEQVDASLHIEVMV